MTASLFDSFPVRGATFANRVVLSPMCQYQAEDGCPTDWHVAHYGRYATSGIGGAIAEATGISAEGRITHGCTGIYTDEQVQAWKPVTAIYRRLGIPFLLQIGHAGPKASTARPWDGAGSLDAGPEGAWQTVSASEVPARPEWHVPRSLTEAEIAGVVRDFAHAAKRALAAGFDGVEIHGAHGYLLHSFMSPVSNLRTDGYGGDLAGRMRLPVEVARAVRAAVPETTPVFYRASCVDGKEGGKLTLDDTVALSHELKAAGVDVLDASGGGIPGRVSLAKEKPEPGFQVPYADRIRKESGLATMAVGLITDAEQAENIVAQGRADLVALARELIRTPEFAYRAARELGYADPASILPDSYAFFVR